MPPASLSRRDLACLVLTVAVAMACVANSLPWLGAGLFCAGLLLAGVAGQRRLGRALAVFGLLYLLVVFGYGVGRDLAHRDNARAIADAPRTP